ncbi:MAG: hypothetical protein K9I59_03840 [Chlorobium sp.]|uniref:hypothetical protein n=1 Tax=Chlorobium sp. TaxID=1095 RepID=UPI0025BA4D21|nr:hypothetical protein [Chlorobium sp.]MCF8216551.1 hypothetical protein [Chlorobium sp.]MCF8270878.1 hypothetical protein [Chlorobium sp.]MCF8287188.1 hypothetical protein [Chlorobium sp.]MCF8290845.1 hypothetical protein [Chlorobium sp.]MCF8385462.1 hypothetical protein [Chlorobium sp.]
MMQLLLPILLLASSWNLPQEYRAYRTQQQAYTLYRSGNYSGAEQRCREALSGKAGHTDRSGVAIRFNLAGALAMQGKHLQARHIYRNLAMNPGDEKIRIASWYNEGTSFAMEALATEKKVQKKALLEQALGRYTTLLLKKPGDIDTRINYEIVLRMLEKLKNGSAKHRGKRNEQKNTGSSNEEMANTAKRILQQAQMKENQLMRQLPRASSSGKTEKTNRKDW